MRKPQKRLDIRVRFEKYVDRNSKGGCHLWLGRPGDVGYGHFHIDGKTHRSHRAAWSIYCGPIPDGKFVLHTCDNKMCVNPEHLFLGTHQDNMADMVSKGRSPRTSGEANGKSKLKTEEVREIRRLLGMGITQREVAEKFNIERSWVSRLGRNEFWRNI